MCQLHCALIMSKKVDEKENYTYPSKANNNIHIKLSRGLIYGGPVSTAGCSFVYVTNTILAVALFFKIKYLKKTCRVRN